MHYAIGGLYIGNDHIGRHRIAIPFDGQGAIGKCAQGDRNATQRSNESSVHFGAEFAAIGYHVVEQYCRHGFFGKFANVGRDIERNPQVYTQLFESCIRGCKNGKGRAARGCYQRTDQV